jgi:hypothetical protein
MRLSPARVEQTLSQFESRVLPDNHPSMAKIKEVWGDHTYFLAVNGLNIVEPLEGNGPGTESGTVVNVASWTDSQATSLAPHAPEPTEVVVEFAPEEEGSSEIH